MNKKKRAKSIKEVIIALVVFTSLALGGVAAFADEALLTPSATQVTAGSGLSFKVNLGEVKQKYSEAQKQFTLTVNINPAPEAVSVSPDVSIQQYGSKYTVSSADLNDITALTFTVYPGSGIKTNTTYTVNANVAGEIYQPSGSFTFTAVPKQEEKKKEDDSKTSKKKGGSGSMSGVSASASASSSSSSTVYKGSADNYLKSLSVDGYDFTQKFNSTRDTYFIDVPAKTESVDVKATAHDSSAAVKVAGNDDLSGDKSKIMISVTADNGDVRVYRIYVTHNVEDE